LRKEVVDIWIPSVELAEVQFGGEMFNPFLLIQHKVGNTVDGSEIPNNHQQ